MRLCPATKSYFRARAAARHEVALFREGFGAAGSGAFAFAAGSVVVAGLCFCVGSDAFGATGFVAFAAGSVVVAGLCFCVGSGAFAFAVGLSVVAGLCFCAGSGAFGATGFVAFAASFGAFGEGSAALDTGTPRATALSPASRPIRCASLRLLP